MRSCISGHRLGRKETHVEDGIDSREGAIHVEDGYYTTFESPVGRLLLTGSERSLTGLYTNGHKPPSGARRDPGRFAEEIRQLGAYFAGELRHFDIAVERAGTAFQLQVWDAMRTIDYGSTVPYAELARRVGRPSAARAVGAACGCNPITIVVPCHRVVGSNGSLTGYAGGVSTKRALLALERAALADSKA
jgi:methylated-DNA-[protein]-cysteine S-methyltransferase